MSKVTPLLVSCIRDKFAKYTKEQCEFALKDINETMAIFRMDNEYMEKLLAERDAAMERLQQIRKQEDTKDKKLGALLREVNIAKFTDIEELVSKAYDLGKASK